MVELGQYFDSHRDQFNFEWNSKTYLFATDVLSKKISFAHHIIHDNDLYQKIDGKPFKYLEFLIKFIKHTFGNELDGWIVKCNSISCGVCAIKII